ncbi:Asp-tRNA(Asn)/Glu-tRNA(Gln) amidotransferase GatCAB subunit A [Granulicella mallensis]|uniref:Amidase n=1 Tax=Granulicella mallensis (strain ATCC BAA-1857 / DSM 23137 / MP5ACTX8) TaxID=682795 RepID=G8P0U1_GRAMM|nr:Asp-tRNA(Asn)/Glu-tRNA(Gln) amidotransferase GatCAB subunit A [Granulicella mallensis]AEU35788.1 Amidase [Granulicella mallensis MP5ACTX8]
MKMLNRREFVVMSAGVAALQAGAPLQQAFAMSSDGDKELTGLTLSEASKRIHAGSVTSTQLTQALLDRIKIYNPKVNAFITVMHAEALEQAAKLDAEAKARKFRSPLHGIPIVLKDNIDTAGTRTTAASEVFDDRIPEQDAEVVLRLKEAGAVILGKANMHEFASGGSSASTYFGPVRNPWALDHIPAGSSGGSAAAVISDLAYGALGTDTGGSVRMPAAYCSIVGLKPTYGLVSIRGIIPLTYSLDHCGPMTKTVEDAAMMLNHMTGYDKRDVASVDHPKEDYVASMKQPVSSIRLGIPRAPFYDLLDPETLKAIDAAIEVLSKLTKSTTECHLPSTAGFSALALGGEREAYHLELFRRNAQRYSLGVRQSLQTAQKTMDDVTSEPCSEKVVDYVTSNWQLILTRKSIDDAFTNFDLVALPTMRILPRTINDALNREEEIKQLEPEVISNCTPFNIFGLPAISIPCGFSASGLPIGLMIAGPRFSEGKVLALANAYEQATQWHTKRPALSPDMVVPPVTRKI